MSLGDFLNEGLGFHQREDRLSEIIKKLEYPRAIWLFKTLNTTMANNIHYFSWSMMTSDPIPNEGKPKSNSYPRMSGTQHPYNTGKSQRGIGDARKLVIAWINGVCQSKGWPFDRVGQFYDDSGYSVSSLYVVDGEGNEESKEE
jgi:hypothetical protein